MEKISKSFELNYLAKDWFCLTLLASFTFLVISPIVYFGIPNGFDLPQHFQFTFTYFESFKRGDFLPGWSAFENYGYGGIGIRIYPPLAHNLLALTQLLINDWVTSAWLNFLFWLLLGSVGLYFFARQWLSPVYSLAAGILYSIAPYHLSQLYQAFLYSEFTAAGILPFCFLFLTRICRQNNLRDVVLFGVSLAFLILAHIPTTLIGLICLGIYTLFILERKNLFQTLSRIIFSGLIGLTASSFYWLKLLTELSLVNHSSPKYASGVYSYKLSFFPLFFSQNREIYIAKQMWMTDIIALFTLMFLLLPIIYLIFKKAKFSVQPENKKLYLAMVVTGGFAFFMSSSVSNLVWENVSFIQKIQFPFRWLSIATLFGSLGFVTVLSQLTFQKSLFQNLKKYFIIIFLFGLFLFNISQIILPSEMLSKVQFEEILDGILEKESYDCWWTIWSKNNAFAVNEKVLTHSRQVSIKSWLPESREFEISEGKDDFARIATFYYPHWKATVNEKPIEIKKAEDGTILIPIPAEKSKVKLTFVEPVFLIIAAFISIGAWLMLIFLGLFQAIKKFIKSHNSKQRNFPLSALE